MISLILSLVTALIFAFVFPGAETLSTIAVAIFSYTYFAMAQHTITLYFMARIIHNNPKLKEDFMTAAKKQYEN